MRIKMIAAKIGKLINIFSCNHSFFCNDLVADLQFFKIFFKRMFTRIFPFCMWLVNIGDRSDRSWRTLYR